LNNYFEEEAINFPEDLEDGNERIEGKEYYKLDEKELIEMR